ncbi:hypothetical protein DXG01_011471 [Tephrocybe rancida]|nr:hypothetical protein DXG01_011471 [Tephrocybe rancida]
MATEIQQLSDLISSSVSALLKACQENNTPFPDPNQPFTIESEAFRTSQVAVDATNIIAAAALQLAERMMPPRVSLINIASGHMKNAALRTALELNVTEVLREAGSQGLHVDEIAKICDVDGNKLGRLLRMLALNHCYREVTPDVYANTRTSSVMDSGKSVAELLEKPEDKHERTSGFVAWLEQFTGDRAKYSSQLFENIKDPITGRSSEPIHTPFNRVAGVDVPYWLWLETDDQVYRLRRFGIAMHGIAQTQPLDILDKVIDWKALPEKSVIVDVGGGIGTASVAVARKNEHLKFIVQDRFSTCTEGTAAPHDFFTPQPVANASVFILKQILHNWADPYCAQILRELRAAATPDTKLVIVDNIVAYACHDPTMESGLGSSYKEAPAPLLPNFGAVNVMPYVADLMKMLLFNSQERTIRQLFTLLQSTGWKLVPTKRFDPPNNFYEPVIAIPI